MYRPSCRSGYSSRMVWVISCGEYILFGPFWPGTCLCILALNTDQTFSLPQLKTTTQGQCVFFRGANEVSGLFIAAANHMQAGMTQKAFRVLPIVDRDLSVSSGATVNGQSDPSFEYIGYEVLGIVYVGHG